LKLQVRGLEFRGYEKYLIGFQGIGLKLWDFSISSIGFWALCSSDSGVWLAGRTRRGCDLRM